MLNQGKSIDLDGTIMTKRNIIMTRQTCTVCEPLNNIRIVPISLKSFDTYQKAIAKIHTTINGAYCSNKCLRKFEKVLKNLNELTK